MLNIPAWLRLALDNLRDSETDNIRLTRHQVVPVQVHGAEDAAPQRVSTARIFLVKTPKHARRRFLRTLAAAPAALWSIAQGREADAGLLDKYARALTGTALEARVAVAEGADAVDGGGKPNRMKVARLLNEAVAAAAGKSDSNSAWKELFDPSDVVGIKVNCLAGRGLSSHPELVAAIVDGLAGAGVSKQNIIVWDRAEHELAAAGITQASVSGAKVLATDSHGVGYEREIEFSGEIGSCFSRIITRMCTSIVNVPVLKDHDLSGVSLGMKNFYGAIHNPNKYHDNNCDPFIADINAHPLVAKKLRLVVCDGLKGQYHGGPASRPQWAWPAGVVLVGTDPVAVDRIGLDMIERRRKEAGMGTLEESGREAKHIKTASGRGLGVGDVARITRVNVS